MGSPFTFQDAKNRQWTVEITTATLKRLKSLAGFTFDDLFEDANPDAPEKAIRKYQAFLDDDIRFSEVLYAVLKPAVDAAGITQEQFDEGLQGEANQRAIMAFHAAYTDFCRPPRKTFLRGIQITMEKAATLYEIGEKRMTKEAAKLTPEAMEAEMDRALSGPSLKLASALADTSASIQAG